MSFGEGGMPGERRPQPSATPDPVAAVATAGDRPPPWYHWEPPAPEQRRAYPPPPKTFGDHFGEQVGGVLPKPLRGTLEATGALYTMFAASMYGLFADIFSRKFKFNEFVERSWFLI